MLCSSFSGCETSARWLEDVMGAAGTNLHLMRQSPQLGSGELWCLAFRCDGHPSIFTGTVSPCIVTLGRQ